MAQEQRAQEIILGTGVDYKPLDFSGLASFANKLNNRAYEEKVKREERKFNREAKAASLGDNLISPVFVNDLKNSYKDLEQQFIDNKITEAEFTGKIDGLIAKNNMYLQSEQQFKEMYGKDGMFLGVDENGNPINAYDSKLGELEGMLQGDNPEEAIKGIYQFRNGYVAPRQVSDIYGGILNTSTKLLNQMASENITDKINFDKATSIEEKVRYLTPKGKQIFLSNLENAHGLDIKEMYAQNNAGIDSFDKYKKDLFNGFTYMGSSTATRDLTPKEVDDAKGGDETNLIDYSNILELKEPKSNVSLKDNLGIIGKSERWTSPKGIKVELDLKEGVSESELLSVDRVEIKKSDGTSDYMEMGRFKIPENGATFNMRIEVPESDLEAYSDMGYNIKSEQVPVLRNGKRVQDTFEEKYFINVSTKSEGESNVIQIPITDDVKSKLKTVNLGTKTSPEFFNVDSINWSLGKENNETQTPQIQQGGLNP